MKRDVVRLVTARHHHRGRPPSTRGSALSRRARHGAPRRDRFRPRLGRRLHRRNCSCSTLAATPSPTNWPASSRPNCCSPRPPATPCATRRILLPDARHGRSLPPTPSTAEPPATNAIAAAFAGGEVDPTAFSRAGRAALGALLDYVREQPEGRRRRAAAALVPSALALAYGDRRRDPRLARTAGNPARRATRARCASEIDPVASPRPARASSPAGLRRPLADAARDQCPPRCRRDAVRRRPLTACGCAPASSRCPISPAPLTRLAPARPAAARAIARAIGGAWRPVPPSPRRASISRRPSSARMRCHASPTRRTRWRPNSAAPSTTSRRCSPAMAASSAGATTQRSMPSARWPRKPAPSSPRCRRRLIAETDVTLAQDPPQRRARLFRRSARRPWRQAARRAAPRRPSSTARPWPTPCASPRRSWPSSKAASPGRMRPRSRSRPRSSPGSPPPCSPRPTGLRAIADALAELDVTAGARASRGDPQLRAAPPSTTSSRLRHRGRPPSGGREQSSGRGPGVRRQRLPISRGGALWLVTGPNMGGKSTFLRQNALIAILAQMGQFRARRAAHIGVVDRVFSASAPPTISAAAARPSWSRWSKPPPSSTAPPPALAGHPRRDRPRHRHLRWPLDRLGGGRGAARPDRLPRPVRDAFPRDDGAGQDAEARDQRTP